MAKKSKAKKKSGRGGGLTKITCCLSPALQEVVKSKKLTRPQVVKKLWMYIKSHKCQDENNRRMINPDKKLAEVFGTKKPVHMLKMAGMLNKHIKQ